MNHRLAMFVLCCAVVTIAGMPSLADAPHLRPGDSFTYDITVQVDERSAQTGNHSKPQTDSSTGAGTATLQIGTVGPDGTANGTLNIQLIGYTHGQPVVLQRTLQATVSPAGEIHPSGSIDPLIDQAIALANQSSRDIAARDVRTQPRWRWLIPSPEYPMTIALNRAVQGQQTYQGLPTLIVQTTGGGEYVAQNDPVQASMYMAGTYYYDQQDGLFVGQAIRTDSIVQDATSGSSVDSSSLVTIVLRQFSRLPTVEEVAPAASASPTPSAEPTQTPTPVPAQVAPSPYPTVPVVTPTP
ncbi:MAG: hypothetical protein JO219_07875 [Candidatus Eremiobacteraeota bacterium]|nr:hypothetical protein [Candidatus Eremiobacteraeota bacterium]